MQATTDKEMTKMAAALDAIKRNLDAKNLTELHSFAKRIGVKNVKRYNKAALVTLLADYELHIQTQEANEHMDPKDISIPANTDSGTQNTSANDTEPTPEPMDLRTRIAYWVTNTQVHPKTRKDMPSVLSRVARHLNAEGYKPESAKYFTAKVVAEIIGVKLDDKAA